MNSNIIYGALTLHGAITQNNKIPALYQYHGNARQKTKLNFCAMLEITETGLDLVITRQHDYQCLMCRWVRKDFTQMNMIKVVLQQPFDCTDVSVNHILN